MLMPTPVNIAELRYEISQKLGPERARRYFGCLERFLSRKLSKAEFDKICTVTLGVENVPVHNQLIRAIVQNVHSAKAPPSFSLRNKDALKAVGADVQLICPNGEIPRSCGYIYGVRDGDCIDKSRSLGCSGRSSGVLCQSSMSSYDIGRRGDELGKLAEIPSKRPRIDKLSYDDRFSTSSNRECKVAMSNDNDMDKGVRARETYYSRDLLAPLGIQPCPASRRKACRCSASSARNVSLITKCSNSGEQSENEDLKKRMERAAKAQGLEGFSLDCANLLNNALDLYLTRLIKSSVDLVRSRSGHEPIRNAANKQSPHGEFVNGMRHGIHMQLPSRSRALEVPSENINPCLVSFRDFNVAMQLNPQQLGEDWPSLIEEISVHSFYE